MSTQPEGGYVPEWTDGDKLRKVRRHLGLTQAEFAEALQVNAVTYSGWESDRNRIKDLKTIARRVKVMSGTPLWWWFDTERPDDGGGDGGGLLNPSGDDGRGPDSPNQRIAPVIDLRRPPPADIDAGPLELPLTG